MVTHCLPLPRIAPLFEKSPGVMDLISSYLYLRRAIGIIGILVPIVLPIGYAVSTGHDRLLASVSTYYYTDMRNIFVGSMCAVGVFLLCYRLTPLDDLLTSIVGAAAILVALCPTVPPNPSTIATVVGYLHIAFAAILLVGFALISWFIFTQPDPARPLPDPQQGDPGSRKNLRNVIYRGCAIVIVAGVALAVLSSQLPRSFVHTYHPLFWCEAVATFAFGVSWLIKGQTLFRDGPGPSAQPAVVLSEEPLPS